MIEKRQSDQDWILLPGTTIGGEVGTFRVDFTIRNRVDGRERTLNGLVDTGASYTVIPEQILDELGIPRDEIELFSLADGSVQELAIGGPIWNWRDAPDPFASCLVPAAKKSCSEPWHWRRSPWPPMPRTVV